MNNNDYDDVTALRELLMAARETWIQMAYDCDYDEEENQRTLFLTLSREYGALLGG